MVSTSVPGIALQRKLVLLSPCVWTQICAGTTVTVSPASHVGCAVPPLGTVASGSVNAHRSVVASARISIR